MRTAPGRSASWFNTQTTAGDSTDVTLAPCSEVLGPAVRSFENLSAICVSPRACHATKQLAAALKTRARGVGGGEGEAEEARARSLFS